MQRRRLRAAWAALVPRLGWGLVLASGVFVAWRREASRIFLSATYDVLAAFPRPLDVIGWSGAVSVLPYPTPYNCACE